jgi:hypothetical protein
MSDLNQQISAWRVLMEQRIGRTATDELEDHLRAIVDSLASSGLSEQERLLLATHRLGHADALAPEFAKNDPLGIWRERMIWMLVGFVPLPLLVELFQNFSGKVILKVVPISLVWRLQPWAAAALALFWQALILGTILGSCAWVANSMRPVRWRSAGRFPTSFSKLAILLGVGFVVLYAGNAAVVALLFRGAGRVDPAHMDQLGELSSIYRVGRVCLSVLSYVVTAVLLAWLMSSRHAEREAVSI